MNWKKLQYKIKKCRMKVNKFSINWTNFQIEVKRWPVRVKEWAVKINKCPVKVNLFSIKWKNLQLKSTNCNWKSINSRFREITSKNWSIFQFFIKNEKQIASNFFHRREAETQRNLVQLFAKQYFCCCRLYSCGFTIITPVQSCRYGLVISASV